MSLYTPSDICWSSHCSWRRTPKTLYTSFAFLWRQTTIHPAHKSSIKRWALSSLRISFSCSSRCTWFIYFPGAGIRVLLWSFVCSPSIHTSLKCPHVSTSGISKWPPEFYLIFISVLWFTWWMPWRSWRTASAVRYIFTANLYWLTLDPVLTLTSFLSRQGRKCLCFGGWFHVFLRWSLMPLPGGSQVHHHRIVYHPIQQVRHYQSCPLLTPDHRSRFLFWFPFASWVWATSDHGQLITNHPRRKIRFPASFSSLFSSFSPSSSFSSSYFPSSRRRPWDPLPHRRILLRRR